MINLRASCAKSAINGHSSHNQNNFRIISSPETRDCDCVCLHKVTTHGEITYTPVTALELIPHNANVNSRLCPLIEFGLG